MLILPNRRQVLTGLGYASGLGLTGTAAYGVGVEAMHGLAVTRYAPVLPGWTPGLHLKVAVLADFHVCEPFMPLDRVAEIVDATNALKPDLVLLLGDYPASGRIAWRRVPLDAFARTVEGLRAPLGIHAVLGNHDWWDDREAQMRRAGPPEAQRALEARGIPVLENDAVRLVHEGRPFWLAGLGDQQSFLDRAGNVVAWRDDLPATLTRITDDAPAILMAHEPDIFPEVPDRFALTLSGHTHGGQIRLLGLSPAIRRIEGLDLSYGHVVSKGRHIIVSGGFGVSRVPVRIGVPPEIVWLDLGRDAVPAAEAAAKG